MPRKKPKVKIGTTVRLRAFNVVMDAIPSWVSLGWDRAHKHDDHPSEEVIRMDIERAVEDGLCELIEFDPGHEDWR
jgi:hypothetical protein